jgi:hypothetical protein
MKKIVDFEKLDLLFLQMTVILSITIVFHYFFLSSRMSAGGYFSTTVPASAASGIICRLAFYPGFCPAI